VTRRTIADASRVESPGNFNKVEKWSRDGQAVEEMLFAGNGLNYALPNALFELPRLCF
jgi:hypothetical protein